MDGNYLNVPPTDFIRVVITTSACSQQQQQKQQNLSSDNSIKRTIPTAPKLKFLLPSPSTTTPLVVERKNNTLQHSVQLETSSSLQQQNNITTVVMADKTNLEQHQSSARKSLETFSKKQQQQPSKKLCTSKQRDYHNALERQRRHLITTSFNQLKNSLPAPTLENVQQEKASRCLIINKACDHIRTIQAGNLKRRQEISDLAEQNAALEELILQLEMTLVQKSISEHDK